VEDENNALFSRKNISIEYVCMNKTQFIFSSYNRIHSQESGPRGGRRGVGKGIKKKLLNGGCMLMTHIFFILPPFCLALMAEWGYLKRDALCANVTGCGDMRKPLICKFLTSKKGLSENRSRKPSPASSPTHNYHLENFRFILKNFYDHFPSPASIYDRRINV
jgi:hypothetical protein